MKKFIMIFLVAGLMITSALSLSSCKKTDTNASEEEWVPTTITVVTNDNPFSRDEPTMNCYYCTARVALCNHGVQWNNGEVCPLGAWDATENPNGHYHEHKFSATRNCRPEGYTTQWGCPYNMVRKHRHLVIYWQTGYDNHWHLGGNFDGM